jgi:hypothetical protein
LTTLRIHNVDCTTERRIVCELLRQSFWLCYRFRDATASHQQRQKALQYKGSHVVKGRKALLPSAMM